MQERSSSNWVLGDVAAAVPVRYGKQDLQRLAAKSGVSYNSLLNWRTVATAYAESERHTGNPFTIYEVFAHRSDRVELVKSRIWTVSEARELVRTLNGLVGLRDPGDDPGWIDRSDLVGKPYPCIYRLLDGTGTVIRAGQASGDLRDRLRGYRREAWWGEVAGLETLRVPAEALTVAEADEIHRWHPRYNDHCPRCGTRRTRR